MSPFLTTLGGGSARGFGHAFRRSTTVAAPGQMAYTTVGNYYFTVPAGVTSLSMVCIGGGGGAGYGGGSLSYLNNFPVTPGWIMALQVGSAGAPEQQGFPSFVSPPNLTAVCFARGGGSSDANIGTVSYLGGTSAPSNTTSGGGGAAGYSGDGGGGNSGGSAGYPGTGGSSGGGGGGGAIAATDYYDLYWLKIAYAGGGGGGGTGILGTGSNGAGGAAGSAFAYSSIAYADGGGGGGGGSGGTPGQGFSGYSEAQHGSSTGTTIGGNGGAGGAFGGSGGRRGFAELLTYNYDIEDWVPFLNNNGNDAYGASGAVRIIWGAGRSYPSNAANV